MNKKLLAVAVAGAFAAPAVFAQSTVTLYGSADVAYVSKKHTAGDGSTHSKLVGIGEGLHAGNRIGFRGDENLGGGLTAMFLIEQGINITNGQLFSSRAAAAGQQYDSLSLSGQGGNMPSGAYSTGTNRQAFVGLKGGWGEVLAGYQYTTLYRISTLSGFFVGSEQPGGNSHGTLDNGLYGGTRANGIVYNSPRFSNFQATFQYGGGAGRENQDFGVAASNTVSGRTEDDLRRWSAMLNYTSGPLNATIGYTKVSIDQAAVTAAPAGCPKNIFGACTATAFSTAAAVDISAKLWQFGASYQAGAFKIAGTYAKGSSNDSVAAATKHSKSYQAGLEYAAGAFRPFITLGRGKTDTAGAETGDYKDTQFGIRYDLSKRTLLYVMHGTTKDNADAPYTVTNPETLIKKRQMTGAGLYMSF
jgi:predicted porin